MFPQIDYTEHEGSSSSKQLDMYKEIAWDFESDSPILKNGDFVMLEGIEAIKTWVYHAIHTQRYRHQIYSWDYGSEASSLIGKGYSKALTKSELKRYTTEALMINPYISDVEVLEISLNESVLSADINIHTIYGEEEIHV